MADPLAEALFIRALPDAMLLLDTSGEILHVNDAASRLLGMRRSELRGRSLSAFVTEPARTADALSGWVLTGQLTPALEPFALAQRPGASIELAGALLYREGANNLIIVRAREREESLEIFGSLDSRLEELLQHNLALSERKAALEQEVRERTELLAYAAEETRAIIDSADDVILTMDDAFVVIDCNRAAEVAFGAERERILGAHLEVLFPGILAREEFEGLGQDTASTSITVPAVLYEQHARLPLEVALSRYHFGDKVRHTCIARDISERLRAQREIESRSAELERINGELEQFTTVASHDLKTPLRKISLLSEIITEDFEAVLPSEAVEHLDKIRDASGKMRGLIDDLLALSRISMAQVALEPVSLNGLIDEILSLLDVLILEVNIEIELTDLGVVMGDARQLRQLFQNLISNAVKFLRPDVVPRLAIYRVAPDDSRDDFIEIVVQDNGVGFPEEKQRVAFEPFRRLHSNKQFAGTGVGLAICKRVVERHGGKIWAKSEPGQGTAFHFLLPTPANPLSSTSIAEDSSTPS